MPIALSTPPFSLSAAQQQGFSNAVTMAALIQARALIAGAVSYSTDSKDLWGEAYIDADGRSNSVVTASTTALFDTNKYKFQRFGLAVGSQENATSATYNGDANGGFTIEITTAVTGIFTNFFLGLNGGVTGTMYIKNQAESVTYATKSFSANGNNALTTADYSAGPLAAGIYHVVFSATGIMFRKNAYTYSGTKFSLSNQLVPTASSGGNSPIGFTEYPSQTTALIVHNIPTGTFASNISTACFKCIYPSSSYESGVSVHYKLTNAGSGDSGWIPDGTVTTFAAFAAEPTTLQVRLTPKTSSPTAFYPAISAFAGAAW